MNERLRELRKSLNLTLGEFGAKIGISIGGLSDIERGRREIQERHILLILSAFPQVSEDWLRNGTGEMFQPVGDSLEHKIAQLDLPDIAQVVVERYQKLPPEARQIVLEYMHSLIVDITRKAGMSGEDLANQGMSPDDEHEALMSSLDKELCEEKEAPSSPGDGSIASSGSDTSAG